MEGAEGGGSGSPGSKQKKNKAIRKKEEWPCCVLGVDISIDEVMEATKTILVGRVKGRNFSANYISKWTNTEWKEAPGKPMEIQALAKGWFSPKFEKKDHLEWVLARNWCFEKRPILFRRWTPLFDA